MDIHPKTLLISTGRFMGASFSVELRGDGVEYRVADPGYDEPEREFFSPSERQWRTFRRTLDCIGVWQWLDSYSNPRVCDGTRWRVEIAYDDARVASHGDNNYPCADGAPSGSPPPTKQFIELTEAVRTLAGGRRFH
jgi:hypothetical protein